jgi:hypothetical protein
MRKYTTITHRQSDLERIMNVIGTMESDTIGRIILVAQKNNTSPKEIIHRLELCIRGMYHPKSFTVCLGCR